MMQKLRKKTRLVLFIALAGFAMLIFFQWGINVTGIKTDQKTDIAKIDGIPISYRNYIRFVQTHERERKGISRDEIWAEMIDQIMWNSLLRKERIRVTDEEIWTIIRNNPPREIYESEYMKDENGEFDFNKYFELLRSPQSRQWLLQYEYSLREQLPKEKLRSLIATMTWVSPFEDSILLALQTTRYDISFITIPLFRLRTLIEISEDKMKEYYTHNLAKFTNPESKILKYVLFERTPSYDDTLETRERMEDFILRIEEGEDFLEVAREVSDDSITEYSFSNINELSLHVRNIYKNLKNGAISSIIEGPQGLGVIKKVRKGLLYHVKAYIQISPTTLAEIYDKIMSFIETAQELGFDSTGVDFGLPVRKTYPLNENNMQFPVRNSRVFENYLSKAKKDEISGPLSGFGSYYLFTVDSIIPEYVPKFETVMPQIRMILEKEKFKEEMVIYLTNISNQLNIGETMEAVASRDTFIIFRNDLKDVTLANIAGSYGDKFAGVAATLEPHQISSPLFTEWAGYIVRCDEKIVNLFDSTMVAPLQIKRRVRLQQLTMNLFTPKEIEDYRDEFFE